MSPATVSYISAHGVLPNLTWTELLDECRAKEDTLIEMCAEQMQIAEALWPDADSEGPADFREAGVTGAELVAGIVSLHEFVSRVMEENERLRAELAAVASCPLWTAGDSSRLHHSAWLATNRSLISVSPCSPSATNARLRRSRCGVVRDAKSGATRWICTRCYQTAKQLPTLRQLVQARSTRDV